MPYVNGQPLLHQYVYNSSNSRLSAEAIGRVAKKEYAALKDWVTTPERHEQLAVTGDSDRAQQAKEAPSKKTKTKKETKKEMKKEKK
ncbi:hypothetical protein N7G274_008120 [Stereocaulon virgatum]|uniref:Uncharacterized protein n=1 Tax=Stereocaulon virgatum TaxID=373712 RepID=A0ABR4A1B2_9LECA